ncbi:TIGR02147 family protein [Bdellovibrio sp. HCB337]|uniref:TIGR02147 family protein n=1 Tax=Bdellovibrio sp. HCB337 TaxID=3394358 RepID=UPI0039A65164
MFQNILIELSGRSSFCFMKLQADQGLIQKILIEDFEKRRIKNPSFSVRAYSRKLGLSHSALSEILSGKRIVGSKLAERLAEALMLAPDVRSQVLKKSTDKSQAQRARETLQLKADQYKVISDWYHFAILSVAETEDFQSDAAWIANRLGLTKSVVQEALLRLERLGMIRLSKKGEIVVTGASFDSPDGIPSSAIRNTHHQYLDLAHDALENTPIEQRYFNGITMAIDPAKLPEAQKRIRQFRDELCQYLESGSKKEIYQLCLQLFPLSKEVQK